MIGKLYDVRKPYPIINDLIKLLAKDFHTTKVTIKDSDTMESGFQLLVVSHDLAACKLDKVELDE
jgi:hypothetical protein